MNNAILSAEDLDIGFKFEIPLGTVSTSPKKLLVFFGNKFSSKKAIAKKWSELDFHFVHQVHGTRLVSCAQKSGVEGDADLTKADAHWTDQMKVAPSIVTADCMPVFLVSEKKLVSIHAGWRGLTQGILEEGIKKLSSNQNYLRAFVGPHISFDSFEIGSDIVENFTRVGKKYALNEEAYLKPVDKMGEKYLVCLKSLSRKILQENGFLAENIFYSDENTFKNPNYHSYRRDGNLAGRQISFATFI